MANTITVTTNANNFTVTYNDINHDYAFNDVNFFLNVSQNRFVELTQRSQDERRFKFDTTEDDITVNGLSVFPDATTLANALRDAIFVAVGEPTLSLNQFTWIFSTDTTATNPGTGVIKYNNADPALVTEIYISAVDNAGRPAGNFIANLKIEDVLLVVQDDDFEKFGEYELTGSSVNNGGWFTLPLDLLASGLLPDDLADMETLFQYNSINVNSVTGDGVDNTDPINPVMSFPTPGQIGLFSPAYAEIFRSSTGNQNLPDAGEVIEFNTSGQSSGVTIDLANDQFVIDTAGVYEINITGNVDIEQNTDYEVFISVNGNESAGRQIGESRVQQTGDEPSLSGSAFLNLAVSDTVQLFVDPSQDSSEFFLQTGSGLHIKRIG